MNGTHLNINITIYTTISFLYIMIPYNFKNKIFYPICVLIIKIPIKNHLLILNDIAIIILTMLHENIAYLNLLL
jgi:hypothetical protein